MRALTDLINQKETAWPDVQSWAADAKNAIEILPTTRPAGEQALLYIQVTTRSPMGAIALETGGIIVDDGFLRILGAGGPRMSSSLVNWNSRAPHLGIKGGLVIALDATGGVFALNDGSLPGARGHVAYFAPDTLEWESLDMNYSEFINFLFSGDLDEFFRGLRWTTWRDDVRVLPLDRAFHQYPPLFTREGRPGNNVSRKAVPAEELVGVNFSIRAQLDGGPS